MTEALPVIFDAFEERDDVRVVVIRGAGERAFISGADISEFEKSRSSEESRRSFDEKGKIAAARIEALTKPIIAMIRGYCIGGGLMAALRADIRIASEDAQFGIPAARLGLGYGYSGVAPLVDLVGPAAANEILFSARRFSADEALRMGLVNRVVAGSALEPAAVDLALRIADNAPLTVRAAKFAIRQCARDPTLAISTRRRGSWRPASGARTTSRAEGPSWRSAGPTSGVAEPRGGFSPAPAAAAPGRRGSADLLHARAGPIRPGSPRSDPGSDRLPASPSYRCISSMSSGSGMTTNSG